MGISGGACHPQTDGSLKECIKYAYDIIRLYSDDSTLLVTND